MSASEFQKATFAGGCFWCMQPPFDLLEGVVSTRVGYTGGQIPSPTYEEVCAGTTGHAEAVEVTYDPRKVSYETLLETFWHNIDPTARDRQFADRGSQYRTAIFYHTDSQRSAAEASRKELENSGKFDRPIVTEIAEAGPFYEAEDYHQEYYQKQPFRYSMYKEGSGRSGYLKRTWEKDHSVRTH